MKIIQDSREQQPFTFDGINPKPEVIVRYLETGDYSIDGYEDRIIIERKSLSDLFGSCGKNRRRFEKVIQRLSSVDHAYIICEADWYKILRSPPTFSQLNPKTVISSIIAWQQRFNIHFWPCVNRAMAEKVAYRILDRFYRDQQFNNR